MAVFPILVVSLYIAVADTLVNLFAAVAVCQYRLVVYSGGCLLDSIWLLTAVAVCLRCNFDSLPIKDR